MNSEAQVARMEPTGPALGRPDDKLRVIRDKLLPDYASLHPGYRAGKCRRDGRWKPAPELDPLMRVIFGGPNGSQRNPFAFQCRSNDVAKAFILLPAKTALA